MLISLMGGCLVKWEKIPPITPPNPSHKGVIFLGSFGKCLLQIARFGEELFRMITRKMSRKAWGSLDRKAIGWLCLSVAEGEKRCAAIWLSWWALYMAEAFQACQIVSSQGLQCCSRFLCTGDPVACNRPSSASLTPTSYPHDPYLRLCSA